MSQRKKAFTLIEILVVLTILAILAALIFPVLANSQRGAVTVEDKSKLRQLALAHNLYVETVGDVAPSIEALITHQQLPKELCASNLDQFSEGMSNAFRRIYAGQAPEAKYKITFFSLSTFAMQSAAFRNEHEKCSNLGYFLWPLDFRHSPSANEIDLEGPYYRVTTEGSLLKRRFAPVRFTGPNNSPATRTNFNFFFSDPDKETEERWLRH